MGSNLTEIVFILDRSGSMAGLESDVIGGFNAFIENQMKMDGRVIVTAVLFDHEYELLWNGIDARKARLTSNEYYVRGCTALLDAVGKTILDVGEGCPCSRRSSGRKGDICHHHRRAGKRQQGVFV